ncbi:MAG: hypothetical protein WD766_01055 [Gemmatimonadota bacterium]
MLRGTPTLLIALSAAATAATPLPAQISGLVGWEGPVSAEDSTRLLRAARSDQTSFERLRRNNLPQTWGGGSSRCDERVGRFCLTHGDGIDDWIAPPEESDVIAARAQLIDGLNQVAQLVPGDDWIAGQRVRYLVEAGRLEQALAAAEECSGEVWWCAALRGYVLHYASRADEADDAFDAALASLDEEERRRWSDLSLILDERSVRRYRRMPEEERPAFEERFWRLSDPLLTRPGNELRSEHFARHVMDQFQYRAQSPDGISWGYDLREILIRYGWPTGWERIRDFGPLTGPPPLVSHYSSAPHYLLPPPEAILDETGTAGGWEAELPKARTGYNIPLEDSVARWFSPLDHQVAVFRRGTRAMLVAGYELPSDSLPEGVLVRASLAVLPTTDLLVDPDIVGNEGNDTRGAMVVEVPARPSLMSLELIVPEERRLARARYGIDLTPASPGLISLSDLLLLRPGEALPDSLEGAVALARGSSRVAVGEQLGVYWEIYGLERRSDAEISISLQLLQGRTGWLRRLAERAGLMREVTPVRLRWQEPVAEGEFMSRSVEIEVPDVAPGTYTLELTVDASGREPLSVRKDIEIGDG